MNNDTLTNRHDFLLLFEVTNGNPNGDPDMGNMPRLDPNTNKGLITDVCQKRKIRNFVSEFAPVSTDGQDYQIFVQQGAVLNNLIDEAAPVASKTKDINKDRDGWEHAALKWLCNRYYDLRAFGGVLSTGNKVFKGSSYGQVRGPVQFTFAQSLHPITPLEISITRCASTNEKEKKQGEDEGTAGSGNNRTMGNKHIVPYALYVAKGYVSPAFAKKTGFTNADLELLFEALLHMFENDRSAARGEMIIRGIYDFEHVGTQHENNAAQNRRESLLGCAHAHKLFEGITVKLSDEALAAGKDFPESFEDYKVDNTWTEENLPLGVKLTLRHEPGSKPLGPRRA
jgi:CRISPR-associated protein Csd2